MSEVTEPSPQQRAIRLRGARSSVLIAAAGSGKTRVLTWLYADAITQHGDRVEQLLAITFTDKAAGELRRRIAGELGGDVDLDRAWIGTFHATCTRLLREFAHHRGLDPAFGVLDELQAQELRVRAWERAVGDLIARHGERAHDCLAQFGDAPLRAGLIAWWEARRSAGHLHPQLPLRVTTAEQVLAAADALTREADALRQEIAAIQAEKAKPLKSLVTRAEQCEQLLAAAADLQGLAGGDHASEPPPAAATQLRALAAHVEAIKVGAGAPLGSERVAPLRAASARMVVATREYLAGPQVRLLAELAERFSVAYDDAKRARDLLDFDDLELQALALLREHADVRAILTRRFRRVFVDEFQDTNPRQDELVDLLAGGRPWADDPAGGDDRPAVTVVGDPRQAIYGFRYADVGLIATAAAQAPAGGHLQLSTNYRTRPPILAQIDDLFTTLDQDHVPVQAGREHVDTETPPVELMLTLESDEESWDDVALGSGAGGVSGTKLAEARLLAARIRDLRRDDPSGTIAVLARARAVLAPIAGALADLGVEAQVDGADGFWQRLEVSDLVHWLRLVRSRADDAALLSVCASPLVGLSTDALTLLGELRAAPGVSHDREARLVELAGSGELLGDDDARRVLAMAELLDAQRALGRDHDPAQLLDEVIAATAYDEHLLTLQDGRRAIANVMRLRRLAGEVATNGGRLADLVHRAQREAELELRAPEAAVSGRGAVRLMTIHQAKGLEFGTVIVAGLGRKPRFGGPAIVGDDERLGLRLRLAPGEPLTSLLDYEDLKQEREEREAAELRRVLYVGLTRAEDRLIVSGVVRSGADGPKFAASQDGRKSVISWLAPALVPELTGASLPSIAAAPVELGGVHVTVSTPSGVALSAEDRAPRGGRLATHRPAGPRRPGGPVARPLPPPAVVSYTALSAHERCALRFHVERVIGLRGGSLPEPRAPRGQRPSSGGGAAAGTAVHAALERLTPDASEEEIAAAVAAQTTGADDDGHRWTPSRRQEVRELVEAALNAAPVQRAYAMAQVATERPFIVALGGGRYLLNGVLDLLGTDASGERAIVVDHKTDKFSTEAPLEQQIGAKYGLQRDAYALAALEAGAQEVEVVHLALRRSDDAVATAHARSADIPALRARLDAAAARLGDAPSPTQEPSRWVCDGCPARGGLCPVPVAQTWGAQVSGQLTLGY